MKVWISQGPDTGDYYMLDELTSPIYRANAAGPMEISHELYERVREAFREFQTVQDLLETLEYGWKCPDDENELDCG